jgi:hypothetical protein
MITALQLGKLGRFANGMFMIAGVIGIARKSGQSYGFPLWVNHDHRDRFGATEDVDIYRHLVNPLSIIPEGYNFREYGYFWGYRDITLPDGNWSIDAHMQCDRFFMGVLDEVREVLRFKGEPPQSNYVAVHYRAGDYQEGENVHHPRCTKEYYERAFSQFGDEDFLLFTDGDINEALSLMPPDKKITVFEGDYLTSFKVMKKCKSFIAANSSYSLMAAILGDHPDKKIVCPQRWFGKAWPNPDEMARDIYPEKSIVL